MDSFDIITYAQLCDKIEQDTSNNRIKMASQALLTAVNDWPVKNLAEPKDFLQVLKSEIGSPLTHQRIENYSRALTVNNPWKMEATSSLLEIFEYDKRKTLDEIINDITIYYKSNFPGSSTL